MKLQRIRLFFPALLTVVMLGGCAEFLDVEPRKQKESDKLYENADGYKTSLNGVYQMLSSESLYGRDASMGMPEMLARQWTVPIGDHYTSDIEIFSKYNFENFRGDKTITSVWTSYYKAIMQLNDLLEHLADPSFDFRGDLRNIVEGEARGLRGFLHLEVLRLWGPAPGATGANPKAVPYVTDVTRDPGQLVSSDWKTVVDGIAADLKAAEELLAANDPIVKYPLKQLNEGKIGDIDPWLSYRQNSFNYFAVLGAQARLYNWIAVSPAYPDAGATAVGYARKVIDAQDAETAGRQFELTTTQTLAVNGLIFWGECLFAVHNTKLPDIIRPLFGERPPELTQNKEAVSAAYELAQGGMSDVRYTDVWQEAFTSDGTYNHFRRFGGNAQFEDTQAEITKNVVPVIRLSEMYLIMVERRPLTGENNANDWFELLRNARSMDAGYDYTMADETARRARLEKEYRKEFYGEGQMFAFYKRQGYTAFSWPQNFQLPNGLKSYELPKPKNQQSFE